MLTFYLKTIGKPELIGKRNNPRFIYNAKDLYFLDKRLIGQFIPSCSQINVIWK